MIIYINYRLLPSNSNNRANLYHLQFQDGATGQQGQEASHCAQASDCEEGCERSSRSFQLQNFIRIQLQLQPPEQFLLWSWSGQGEHEPSCLPSYVKITTFIIIVIVKSIIICVSSINQQSEKSSNSSCKTASSSSASYC